MTIQFPPAPSPSDARFELAVEERPRRAFTSINVQFEAKEVFDVLLAQHTARTGVGLRQPDFFNVLLAEHLERHVGDLPSCLRRLGSASEAPGVP